MTINKISETILEKVKLEAKEIINEAEEKALQNLNQATEEQEARSETEKGKLVNQAEAEAARILAKATITARQEITAAKSEVVDKIINQIKIKLGQASAGSGATLNLIMQSLDQLGAEKAVLYVTAAEVATVQKLVKGEKDLSKRIIEVREGKCSGGVITEDEGGHNRIDNSFEARLEKLLPLILPQISKELFKT